MQRALKKMIVAVLANQVRRLRAKRTFKVVAVAGSIGKTSTKFAITAMLGTKYRVRFQEGNYNDIVTVPLIFFGLPLPSLRNPFAWIITLLRIELQLLRPYNYDVVVVELGTDGPGQLIQFKKFLQADVGILTAIAPEHMEFFGGLSAVAKEELVISELSEILLVNSDLCDPRYMPTRPKLHTYGMKTAAEYQIRNAQLTPSGYSFAITKLEQQLVQATHPSISTVQLYSLAAAVAAADTLALSLAEISTGIGSISAVPGRMQLLGGINQSTIIDDTYNASPEAAKAALTALYELEGGQKIAVLGSMNELGGFSASAHADVGAFCDPARLSLVITLGPDANEYLAPAAEKQGCKVERFDSPYTLGGHLRSIIEPNAVVLLKGSQNKVFAEEAIKSILANPADASRLVRQSDKWLRLKRQQFTKQGTK